MRARGSAASLILLTVVPISCGRVTDDRAAASVQVAPRVIYSLEDGELYHRDAPDTFEIPSLAAREALVPGQIVKLMFRITKAGESQVERMWVIVGDKDADGYVEALDNQPATTDVMQPGMNVHFQSRHVIAIHSRRTEDKPAA